MTAQVTTRTGAVVLAALAMLGLGPHAATPAHTTSLGVAGRSNATPWVAGGGSLVAVAWGASVEGKTDVFVAVSHDGGQTFGAPVQVNTIAGEARLGGELPPRVALTSGRGSSQPEIVVLWTARGAATAIKTARSRDGGKTFEPPVALQGADAAGDRGWPSLALDSRGPRMRSGWIIAALRGTRGRREPGSSRAAPRTTAWRWRRSQGCITPLERRTQGRARAGKGRRYCCKTALAAGADQSVLCRVAACVPREHPGYRLHVLARRRPIVCRAHSSERGHLGDQRMPRRRPRDRGGSRGQVHLVWPTVVGGPNPEGALFYASTRDGRTFTPRTRIPTLGSAAAHASADRRRWRRQDRGRVGRGLQRPASRCGARDTAAAGATRGVWTRHRAVPR